MLQNGTLQPGICNESDKEHVKYLDVLWIRLRLLYKKWLMKDIADNTHEM